MEERIELKEYFNIIKKRLPIILKITIAIAIIAGLLGILSKDKVVKVIDEKVYEATANVIISYDIEKAENTIFKDKEDKKTIDIINRNINYNKSLLSTYAEMLITNKTIEEVENNLNLNQSISDLKNNIKVSPIGESQLLKISVQNTNPKVAMDIANEIPKVFKHDELNLKIIDKAIEPTKPMPKLDTNGKPIVEKSVVDQPKPSKIKKIVMNIVIGLFIGSMISLFIVFLQEYIDDKVRNVEDIQRELELSVLGVVPNSNKDSRRN